jgi:hypothetical protein
LATAWRSGNTHTHTRNPGNCAKAVQHSVIQWCYTWLHSSREETASVEVLLLRRCCLVRVAAAVAATTVAAASSLASRTLLLLLGLPGGCLHVTAHPTACVQ